MNPSLTHIVLNIGGWVLVVAVGGALAWRGLRKSQDAPKLVFKLILTAGIIGGTIWLLQRLPPAFWPAAVVVPAITIGVMWAPSLGSFMAGFLTNAIDGGDVPLEAQPFYSIAESKRRNGHPQEAITLVREQLEKFPGDLHGTMLLASILVEDMNDLPGAQLTLERWMEGPGAETVSKLK